LDREEKDKVNQLDIKKDAIPEVSGTSQNKANGDSSQPTFKSMGTRIHNELTYRGVDWLLNSSVGVAFTYWTARTQNGQKYFGKPVANFVKAGLKPFLKNEAHLNEGAKWGAMFASIMAGGTAIIPPMIYLENKHNKKKIVRALDNMIYGKEEVDSDPRFAQCYEVINNQPPKDFTTGMLARGAALVPLIAITTMPVNKQLIKHMYDPIGRISKKVVTGVGIKPNGYMMKVGTDGLTNWDFMHRTVGFDFGQTIFYSAMHEVAYKQLAKLRDNKGTNGMTYAERVGKREKDDSLFGSKPDAPSFARVIASEITPDEGRNL
jgi:hypothetical protein